MAGVAPDEAPCVALVPWGDTFEQFLDPIGLDLADFVARMSGGWLFGYAAALRHAGWAPIIVVASSTASKIREERHRPTGTPIVILPRDAAQPRRSATMRAIDSWRHAPVVAFAEVLRTYRCSAVILQEYEYARSDRFAGLCHAMGLPVFASFQGGDRTEARLEAFVRRHSMRRYAGLLVASSEEAARLNRYYPGLRVPVHGLPNPIDASEWRGHDRLEARRALGLDPAGFIVMNHGRIEVRRKGLDVMIDAWKPFAARDGATLVIIGTGADHDDFAARLAAARLPNLRWISEYRTDRPFLRRWLSAADVHLSTSRVEGMPVAPLEAMSCGLPIVATDAQGLSDILVDGEKSGGILVRRDDPHAVSASLRRLQDQPLARRAMGLAARERVECAYALPVVGAGLAAVLGNGSRNARLNS